MHSLTSSFIIMTMFVQEGRIALEEWWHPVFSCLVSEQFSSFVFLPCLGAKERVIHVKIKWFFYFRLEVIDIC